MTNLPIYIQERLSTNKDEILRYYPKSKNELVDIILNHFNNGIGDLNDIDTSKLKEEAFYRLFHDLNDEIKKNKITEIDISTWDLKKLYCFNDIGMFEKCNTLETIILPECLEVIGKYTFYYNDLYNIIIPDLVTSIGDYAFYDCSRLTSLNIPDLVISIGNSAFAYCSGLTSVNIPDSVKSIGDYAFDHCNKLTSLTIPDSVTSIGNWAFNNCHVFLTITVSNEHVKKLVEKSGFNGKIEIK